MMGHVRGFKYDQRGVEEWHQIKVHKSKELRIKKTNVAKDKQVVMPSTKETNKWKGIGGEER